MSLLSEYRRKALTAARDFNYGDGVIRSIKNAKTEGEIQTIMVTARKEKWRD